jgi:hypothetical protein
MTRRRRLAVAAEKGPRRPMDAFRAVYGTYAVVFHMFGVSPVFPDLYDIFR